MPSVNPPVEHHLPSRCTACLCIETPSPDCRHRARRHRRRPFICLVWRRSAQVRQFNALENAGSIVLALRLYASDHAGNYPSFTLRDGKPTGIPVPDSNTAFAQLFPDYINIESVFWLEFGLLQSQTPTKSRTSRRWTLPSTHSNPAKTMGLHHRPHG